MRALVDRPPAQFDRAHNDVVTALHVTGATTRRPAFAATAIRPRRLRRQGAPRRPREWRYEGQLLLRRRASHWLVDWRTRRSIRAARRPASDA